MSLVELVWLNRTGPPALSYSNGRRSHASLRSIRKLKIIADEFREDVTPLPAIVRFPIWG